MDVIKGMARARESGYFKLEQEADVQKHRKRLISRGIIDDAAGLNLRPKRHTSMEESVKAFEILPEVLQQQARVDDPHAAARKDFIRKVESRQYRSAIYGVAAAVGHIPRTRLGRNHWHDALEYSRTPDPGALARVAALSPEAQEAARRTYSAGVRSLAYGAVAGVVGVGLLATLGLRWGLDVRSVEDFKAKLQGLAAPLADGIQTRILPVKESLQGFFGGDSPEGEVRSPPDQSEFARRLSRRYRPKKGNPDDSSGGISPLLD